MKLTAFAVVALLGASASAAVIGQPLGTTEVRMKRQSRRPDVSVPSMTDANGNVVPYSREGVVRSRKTKAKRALEAEIERPQH